MKKAVNKKKGKKGETVRKDKSTTEAFVATVVIYQVTVVTCLSRNPVYFVCGTFSLNVQVGNNCCYGLKHPSCELHVSPHVTGSVRSPPRKKTRPRTRTNHDNHGQCLRPGCLIWSSV